MKSRKWKKISALLFLGIALLFLLMPTYMQEALIHWFPDISDTYIFPSDTVRRRGVSRKIRNGGLSRHSGR